MPGSLYFADKPSGILTHTDGQSRGFVDYLNETLSLDLKVVHRLDRDTTGAMIFARDKEAAAQWTEHFTSQNVQKTYLFVTDRSVAGDNLSCDEDIEGKSAQTTFRKLESSGRFHLWQAEPKTGRTHQIRRHAQVLGISLLGDTLYGGTRFPKMLLHCQSLVCGELSQQTTPPQLMQNLALLESPQLSRWLLAWDRRQRLFPELVKDPEQSLRLLDDKEHGFAIDRYADVVWFYAFRDQPPTDSDIEDMKSFTHLIGAQRFEVRHMKNRGAHPHREATDLQTWTAKEHQLHFSIRAEQGWSPGLFLDQRRNRGWVSQNSRDRKVLNLFCYTAGFSIASAIGGASEVTSVDTSRTTLDWATENFKLNGLDIEKYEFWAADARTFLKGALNRGRKFDLIVCDPPSFARNKKGVFRFEEEAESLVKTSLQCLSSSGQLLFSCNFEKWSESELCKKLQDWCPRACIEQAPGKDLDYSDSNTMKSFILSLG